MSFLAKSKQYQQKFRPEWKKDKKYETWLMHVDGDETQARCRFCSKTFGAKLQNINRHLESDGHQQHERDRGMSGQNAQRMENFVGAGTDKVRKKKEAELHMAAFVAEHSTFRAAPDLSSVINNLSELSPQLGKTKSAMLIKNVLAPSYKADLIASVKGKPFTLVIDEATDCSVRKALGRLLLLVLMLLLLLMLLSF